MRVSQELQFKIYFMYLIIKIAKVYNENLTFGCWEIINHEYKLEAAAKLANENIFYPEKFIIIHSLYNN